VARPYSWQFHRHWLVGIEAGFDASNVQGEGISRIQYSTFDPVSMHFFGQPANLQASEDSKWFGTVKSRLGFAPTEKSLLFITGGLAYGRVNQAMTVNLPNDANLFGGDGHGYGCGPTGGANCFIGANSKFAVGYTVGGGLEIALTHNLTVRTE